MKRRIIAAAVLLAISLAGLFAASSAWRDASDPLYEGKRISEWAALAMADSSKTYGFRSDCRKAFHAQRDPAIRHLIREIYRYPNKMDQFRARLSVQLAKPLAKLVRPKLRYHPAPWRGLVALRELAQKTPDERITRAFEEAMDHPNFSIRRVAAYESGPWLNPADHNRTVGILRRGLNDKDIRVRIDACRRICSSANSGNLEFNQAARGLIPDLQHLRKRAVPNEILYVETACDALIAAREME